MLGTLSGGDLYLYPPNGDYYVLEIDYRADYGGLFGALFMFVIVAGFVWGGLAICLRMMLVDENEKEFADAIAEGQLSRGAYMAQSDQFNGRLGLIFASIGAAIGTGNIWRFPRMVGANGGGTFLIPWLIFLFAWSIPLVIAEFAMGKRSRTGTIGIFRIFAGKKFAWMGLWTAWISTAIGFYYAIVAGWTIKYFQLGITGGLTGEGVDTTEVWNSFLQSPGQVIFFQFLVIVLTSCYMEGC